MGDGVLFPVRQLNNYYGIINNQEKHFSPIWLNHTWIGKPLKHFRWLDYLDNTAEPLLDWIKFLMETANNTRCEQKWVSHTGIGRCSHYQQSFLCTQFPKGITTQQCHCPWSLSLCCFEKLTSWYSQTLSYSMCSPSFKKTLQHNLSCSFLWLYSIWHFLCLETNTVSANSFLHQEKGQIVAQVFFGG